MRLQFGSNVVPKHRPTVRQDKTEGQRARIKLLFDEPRRWVTGCSVPDVELTCLGDKTNRNHVRSKTVEGGKLYNLGE